MKNKDIEAKYKILNPDEHPKGLSPEERKEWHELSRRFFELYKKMPFGDSKRKVIAGMDEEGNGSMFIIFKGIPKEIFEVRAFLDSI